MAPGHKHVNIESIAAELGIGLNSIVFVEDNPIECELIRQMLPEVEWVLLPPDPAGRADLVLRSWYFDKLVLTEEDSRKTEQYGENAARAARRGSTADLSAYLESLGTFVPTQENRPAEPFYESQGFSLVSVDAEGGKDYRIAAAQAQPRPCAVRHVIIREEQGRYLRAGALSMNGPEPKRTRDRGEATVGARHCGRPARRRATAQQKPNVHASCRRLCRREENR
ncbi:MAG TPA: hypothetical protein VE175_12265 [Woeseiaceae bacterium]|nr:hypothetical protein [Woeseiaceae bacterium]